DLEALAGGWEPSNAPSRGGHHGVAAPGGLVSPCGLPRGRCLASLLPQTVRDATNRTLRLGHRNLNPDAAKRVAEVGAAMGKRGGVRLAAPALSRLDL